MSGSRIEIEKRKFEPGRMKIDLINHLRTRVRFGSAVIVADNPPTFLSTLRKQWIREMLPLKRARASTLDAAKIAQLSQEILIMETLQFDARGSGGNSADVYILSPSQIELIPTHCATIYICSRSMPNIGALNPLDTENLVIIDYSAGDTSLSNHNQHDGP